MEEGEAGNSKKQIDRLQRELDEEECKLYPHIHKISKIKIDGWWRGGEFLETEV